MAFDVNGAKTAGYSDSEIIGFLAPEKKFDVQKAKEAGYNDNEILSFLTESEKPTKDSALRQAADLPVNFAKGVTSGVRFLTDAFGADNAVSKNLRGVEDYFSDLLSATAKNDQKEFSRIMDEAKDKGVGDQLAAAFQAVKVAPLDLMSQAFGTIIPTLAGGVVGAALKAPKLAAIATSATMGAGAGKSSIYDAVLQELKGKVPEEQAIKAATQAQEYGGQNLDLILGNTLLGAVAGGTGAERLLVPGMVRNMTSNLAKKGVVGRALTTGGVEALTEGGQGGFEQFGQNVALQREGFDTPTFRGVAGAAGTEAMVGGGLGTAVGSFSRPSAAQPTPQPTQEQTTQEQSNQALQDQALQDQALQAQAAPPAFNMPAIPQPRISEPYVPLSDAEAREQNYQNQINKQDAFQAGIQPFVVQPPAVGQARPAMTEQMRIDQQVAAQQQMDADRFQQQTIAPTVSPAQTIPRVPTPLVNAEDMRQRVDAQSELLGQTQGLPLKDQAGLRAQADIAGGTGQIAQPQTRFVSLDAMTPREARQKLAVLKEDLKVADMPVELAQFRAQNLQGPTNIPEPETSLHIVPHPTIGGRYAIEERVKPQRGTPKEARPSSKGMSEAIAVAALRKVEQTGVVTPEAIAASQQFGFNLEPLLANFNAKQTSPDIISQQRQGMADEAALNAELRGGFATREEAQRLREQRMGMPYDTIQQPTVESRELGLSERERRLNAEAETARIAANRSREAIARRRFQEKLQGPEVDFLEGFDVNMDAEPGPASPEFIEQFMKPEGRMSLATGEATPALKDTVADLRKKLIPILRRFGLEKLGLNIVHTIENGKVDGMFSQQVITLAMDSDNPMGVMRHEVIHALKELGAFTDAEWRVLTKAAKDKYINQFFNRDMQNRYQQVYLEQNGNLDGFPEYLQEEAIAQAFRFFSEPQNKPPVGMIANLMRRLNKMFDAIKEFFGAKGLTNIDDMFLPNRIFADIERGAITPGRADVGKMRAPRYSVKFTETGDITPLTVQNVRIYNKEIESLVKKIGDRIAGMKSDKTVDDVRTAIKKLQSYTARGLKGREWYENSSKAILEAFNGDPVLAEKLFQIIAITSANTEVAANFTKATNAWSQFAKGKPIKVGTGQENKKIEALLYFGVDWDGRKTNTFYTNLMEAMEGKDSGRSTIDLHMTRMIFDKDAPTDAQYELAENMVRLLASKLDIPPRQVQAASWVTQKAKTMFEDYRKKGWKKDLNDDQLREFAFERAVTDYSHLMKAKVKQLAITDALREPSPEIRARTQTITGEVIPSVKTEMSEMEDLPFAEKAKLTKSIKNSDAIENIANALGLSSRVRVTVESGAYEGKVNPNLKVQVINNDAAVAEKDAQDLAYAMSYVFKQDATPFFRADPSLIDQEQYGILFKLGRNALTPTQQKKILDVMSEYLGPDAGFSKVGPNEIVVINYRGEDGEPFLMSDAEFVNALAAAREQINNIAPIDSAEAFGAKSEYPYHDWQADSAGNAIIERLYNSRTNKPDLQARLDDLRESFVGEARDAITKAGGTPRFSLREAGPDQSALRPSPSRNAGISFNPTKEDAVSYQGSHYGRTRTDVLDAAKYGTGLRGAEARRLEQSDDPRIKRRVYFYIPRANDTMPNRESGVGGYVYTQKLDNILPPGATMSRLTREAGGDSNVFESLIVDNRYDGYAVPDYGMMVVLNNNVPVKYEGTVDQVHGGTKFSLRAPTTQEFKSFFGKSKIVNPDGTPKVMYHGTSRDITEFRAQQAGAIFLAPDPLVSEGYADTSDRYIKNEIIRNLPAAEQKKLVTAAIKQALSNKDISTKSAAEFRAMPLETAIKSLREYIYPMVEDRQSTFPNIMPVYVRAENPFDFEQYDANSLNAILNQNKTISAARIRGIMDGMWSDIESPEVQSAIRDAGFDAFYVMEAGRKNLAVYDPRQVKSAIGNRGTFDPTNPDIRYSLKNAPPNTYTKVTPNPANAGEAVVNAANSVFNAVRSDTSRTSARINLIDKFSGLTQTLSSLPLFSGTGTLRADMLHHAKAQDINLIKGGLVTGTPYITGDGSIAIERSENNLARALSLIDKLDINKNVVDSGLTGRSYVSNIMRNLRGADILAEDADIRKEGDKQIIEAKKRSDALKTNAKNMTPKQIVAEQKEINKLRQEGNRNRKIKRELQVKPEDIAWAEKQLKITPEVQDILDIYKAVNTSLVNLYENSGMLDKATADKYRAQKNYVPLFKSREDLNEEAFFQAGSGTKSVPKIKALKGADIDRNILENIDKQYAVMIAGAYENQTRRISVEQMRSIDPNLAVITNSSDPRVNLRYRENGKDVHVFIENPNDLAAFQSMTHQMGPVMKFLGGFTQVLRAGALINPMFWLRQLIRDPIHASLTAQSGIVTPFHSAKEFLAVITKNSDVAKILADRGVIGQFDSTLTLSDYLKGVGADKVKDPNVVQRGIHKLLEIHEASDAATRIAIYKKAKAKALKDGMSEAQAVDFAVFKARESINFALTGDSSFLAAARQMIPFLNATIVGLDTLYRAATGYGLNPEEKAKARAMFATRAMMFVGMSFAYAALMHDDEEYKKLPDYVKDGNYLFPVFIPGQGKTFIKIPVPYEVGYLFKTLPEVLVRYMAGTSTGKEALASIKTGFIHNMPTGGTPIPQFAKPTLEVVSNYSFFTGRPIEGMSDSRLPVADRGQKASEFAKMMSKMGLDNIGMSPAKIDVFIKGTFAEMGAMTTELADALINAGSGKELTPRNFSNLPAVKAFLTDPQVDKAVSDYYNISKTANEVAASFTASKNSGDVEKVQAMLQDQDKRLQIAAAPSLRKIGDAMSDINKAIRIIDKNQSLSPEDRRARINELERRRNAVAAQGVKIAETIGLDR